MTRVLYGLGQLCARRRWIVLGLWLVLLVGLATASGIAGSALNNDLSLPGTDSQAAGDLLTKRFPTQANGMNPLMLQAPKGHKVTDKQYAQPVADVVSKLSKEDTVHQAVSPLSDQGKAQVSKDGRTAYVAMYLKTSAADLTEDQAQQLLDDGDPAQKAGLSVSAGGYVGQSLSAPATESSEVVGLVMAVIVLLFTFGTFVAMGMPIITAIFGLVSGLSLITLLSHAISVPTIAPTLATMIGLGVGIDYALFIVSRHRENLRNGMPMPEAIARAIASSGGAVVFAGATVIVALASLAVVGIPLVSTLGFTAALVVLLAVIAAVTLLPALLAVVGPRIDKLPLPIMRERRARRPTPEHPGFWAGWGRFVAHHPIPTGLLALAALLALAIPMLTMWLGQEDNGALPQSTQSRQSYDAMTEGFGVGYNGPFLISVDLSKQPAKADQSNLDQINQQEQQQKQKATDQADQQEQALEAQGVPPDQAQAQVQPQLNQQLNQITDQANQQKQQADQPATDPRLQTLRTDLQKTPGVKSVTQPLVNSKGTAAVMNLIATTAPSDEKTSDLVDTLREDVIPKAIKGADMEVYVGGSTAGNVDLAEEISNALPRTIAVVIGLSFILLVLAFRSLVIPLTAAVMNVLSIGAAFGVVTAGVREGLPARPGRAGSHGPDRQLRALDDVRRAVRAVDGLRGVPDQPHAGGLGPAARQPRGGHRRRGHDGHGDHGGRPDHGQRLLRLHHQRRPGGQAVRRRVGRGDPDRRHARAPDPRARGDGADRPGQLVVPALAAVGAQPVDRGRGVVPPPRRAGRRARRAARRRPTPRRSSGPGHLASSQVRPAPTSTASGGSRSSHGATISRSSRARTGSSSSGRHSSSSSSWIVRTMRAVSPSDRSARAAPIIASFITSAAVPWMTVLTARRSPSERTCQLRARSSGIWRRRPKIVVT